MACLTSNNIVLFGEAPWEKHAEIYGEMLLEGNPSAFTGDMKHWMLNSSLNRRGIVT